MQCLNCQCRCVMLARRQTADRFDDFFAGQFSRFADSEPFDHFRQRGTARECRRAAVSEETCGFNAAVVDA